MTQVKTFLAYVEDKEEWGFEDAFVVIHTASETSQSTFDSKECTGDYAQDVTSHVIKYKARFFKDKKTQLQGKSSRVLFDKFFVEPVKVTEKDEKGKDKKDSNGKLIFTGEVIKGYWEFDETFTVDLGHEQAKQVMNSGSSKDDTIFNLIEFDLKRRFKQ